MKKERFIPGTNPKWGRKLPEGYCNSLVDSNGYPYDNGYNFDEPIDEEETSSASPEHTNLGRNH